MSKPTQTGVVLKATPIEQLLILRRRRKWSQSDAAMKLGVTPRALRSWEENTSKPKPIVVKAIQDFVDKHSKN